MSLLADDQSRALEPLRSALLAAARRQAREQVAAARAQAGAVSEAAHAAAQEALAQARTAGEQDAAEEVRRADAALQRERRVRLMRVRRQIYEEAGQRARDAVRDWLADPATRAALTSWLDRAVGGGSTVRPLPDGGLVAESGGGRRASASVEALVDEAMAGVDVDRLWRRV